MLGFGRFVREGKLLKAIIPFVLVSQAAAIFPANYDVTVTCDKTVREETVETALAFRMPETCKAVTTCNLTVGISENVADGYRITFNAFGQNLYMGETVFADEENLSKSFPGKWIEFTVPGLAAGEFTRDPNLTVESEYLDYGLFAFMLLYESEEGSAGETVFSVVERTLPNGNSAKSVVSSSPAESGAGDAYNVSVDSELSQDTSLSKMTGSASLSGIAERVVGADGRVDCARAELDGARERTFTIVGKDALLKEDVKLGIVILREGVEAPAAWGE
jgi:hypothetical protein